MQNNTLKELFWMGSSLKALRDFPEEVKDEIGYTLFQVQQGLTPRSVKSLKGYGGATVLEVIENFDTDTYRAIYTVRFAGTVYVLHAFQKKSKRGVATSQADLDLISYRLQQAKEHYDDWLQNPQKGD